jgi:hypothetical protein
MLTADKIIPEIKLDSKQPNSGIKLDSKPSPPSPSTSRQHGKNMRRLVKLVSAAFLNPREFEKISKTADFKNLSVYVPWDAEEFYIQVVKGGKDKKREKFPSPEFGFHSKPLIVVDIKGRIILWYLPGLVSIYEEVRFDLCQCKLKTNKCIRNPF